MQTLTGLNLPKMERCGDLPHYSLYGAYGAMRRYR